LISSTIRRLVADIEQVRELSADDDLGDLFDEIGLRHRIRDRRDHDVGAAALLFLGLVFAAQPDRARAVLVDLTKLDLVVQDLATGRKVRTVDERHQLDVVDVAVVRERDGGGHDFAEVVRWNVRRHAYGDAGRAVDDEVWIARG
jgi:hypothetical protein